DAVSNLIDLAEKHPELQLVIRLHPHLLRKHPDDLARWRSLVDRPSVIAISPESPVDTYALIEASDTVITGGSTVGIEAVYWGRPSILLGPSDYDLLGAVHVAESNTHLEELMASD